MRWTTMTAATLGMLACLTAPAAWAQDMSCAALLKDAQHQEEVLGNLEAARATYAAVLARNEATIEQKIDAHLHLGFCLEKLGRAAEAQEHFTWISTQAPPTAQNARFAIAEARRRLAGLSAPNPAEIMPADTVLYVEVIRPGEQLEQLLEMIREGGLPDPLQMLTQHANPSATGPADIGQVDTAISMPMAMMLNPSLVNEFKKIQGLAFGITDLDNPDTPQPGDPSLVAVLYPGESDAVRGMLQLLVGAAAASMEPHGQATIYRLRDDSPMEIHVALTPDAVVLGSPRAMVTDTLDRMNAPAEDSSSRRDTGAPASSLAANEKFRRQAGARRLDSAVMLYCDLDRLFRQIAAISERENNRHKAQGSDEFGMLRDLLDLDALEQVSARSRLTDDGLLIEVAANLKPGERNAVYEIFRTPPADRGLLTFVPVESIGFATMSLGDAGERYDRLVAFVELLERHAAREKGEPPRETVREGIAEIEQALGIALRDDLVARLDSALLAVVAPDAAAIETAIQAEQREHGDARPFHWFTEHTSQRLFLTQTVLVVRVNDTAAFDRTLETMMNAVARRLTGNETMEGAVKIEAAGRAELRRYITPGAPQVPIVGKVDDVYVIGLGEPAVRAAMAAHDGKARSIASDGPGADVITSIPPAASKIAAFRVDLMLNMLRELSISAKQILEGTPRQAQADPRWGGLVLVETPAMRPMFEYTLESDGEVSARYEIRDVPVLIGTLVNQIQSRDTRRTEIDRTMRELRSLAILLQTHVVENRGRMPESLDALDALLKASGADPSLGERYTYVRPVDKIDQLKRPAEVIVFHTTFATWPAGGVAAAFADGHVELIRDHEAFKRQLAVGGSTKSEAP